MVQFNPYSNQNNELYSKRTSNQWVGNKRQPFTYTKLESRSMSKGDLTRVNEAFPLGVSVGAAKLLAALNEKNPNKGFFKDQLTSPAIKEFKTIHKGKYKNLVNSLINTNKDSSFIVVYSEDKLTKALMLKSEFDLAQKRVGNRYSVSSSGMNFNKYYPPNNESLGLATAGINDDKAFPLEFSESGGKSSVANGFVSNTVDDKKSIIAKQEAATRQGLLNQGQTSGKIVSASVQSKQPTPNTFVDAAKRPDLSKVGLPALAKSTSPSSEEMKAFTQDIEKMSGGLNNNDHISIAEFKDLFSNPKYLENGKMKPAFLKVLEGKLSKSWRISKAYFGQYYKQLGNDEQLAPEMKEQLKELAVVLGFEEPGGARIAYSDVG